MQYTETQFNRMMEYIRAMPTDSRDLKVYELLHDNRALFSENGSVQESQSDEDTVSIDGSSHADEYNEDAESSIGFDDGNEDDSLHRNSPKDENEQSTLYHH